MVEVHESQVAEQTMTAINKLLDTYNIMIANEKVKEQNRYKIEVLKVFVFGIVIIIVSAMLLLTPSKIDVKNTAESKSEVITSDMERQAKNSNLGLKGSFTNNRHIFYRR